MDSGIFGCVHLWDISSSSLRFLFASVLFAAVIWPAGSWRSNGPLELPGHAIF